MKWKKRQSEAEHALEVLGGACVDIQKFQLPDSEMNRAFVIIEKKKGHRNLSKKSGNTIEETFMIMKIIR